MTPFPGAGQRRREPLLNLPAAVALSLTALVAIHAWRSFALTDESDVRLLLEWGFIPARVTLWWDPATAEAILRGAGVAEGQAESFATVLGRYVVAEHALRPWSALTYALLHGSWAHVILNAVWIAAFGTPVARRCGAWGFLGLGALGAVAGAAAHWSTDPYGVAPLVGASAAGTALMAAAVRFVFAPAEPVFLPGGVVMRQPALRLGQVLSDRRAVLFLGVWLVTNFAFGLGAGPLGIADAAIAWQAHLGGFLAGLLLFPLFDPRQPRPASS